MTKHFFRRRLTISWPVPRGQNKPDLWKSPWTRFSVKKMLPQGKNMKSCIVTKMMIRVPAIKFDFLDGLLRFCYNFLYMVVWIPLFICEYSSYVAFCTNVHKNNLYENPWFPEIGLSLTVLYFFLYKNLTFRHNAGTDEVDIPINNKVRTKIA